MAGAIEDYGLIGDTHTAALVCRDGSIDWLCLPRFDSSACFAALLGDREHGRFRVAPAGAVREVRRRYRPGTLILETDLHGEGGAVRLIDFMALRTGGVPRLVRIVEAIDGPTRVVLDLTIRFDYGAVVPWVQRMGDLHSDGTQDICALAGPEALHIASTIPLQGEGPATVGEATLAAGERGQCVLSWYPSHQEPPPPADPERLLAETEGWWREWDARGTYSGSWGQPVRRSLLTLKALTYEPTGGIVAAPTTSLPELIGGERNWDYRYCWLRDATFTLYALSLAGYDDEARAWRDWLVRAVAGEPAGLQIMYGVAGERRLDEWSVAWLPGYEGSTPVRVGNGAHGQFQLDVYGELIDALHLARRFGLREDRRGWEIEKVVLDWLESNWQDPDYGIWEIRGEPRHFTHSKVMAWVAMDRAVKGARRFGLDGPVVRWRALRARIHREICERAVDPERGNFTQSYGSRALDAALLMLPMVGFVKADDPRMLATIEAIQRELTEDGFVLRYRTEHPDSGDGLQGGEGTFLACSFWLVDNLAMAGRRREGKELFERLLDLRNDLGLLAEEYDPVAGRQLGNFPQALSHLALVNAAHNLTAADRGPAVHRFDEMPEISA